MSRSFICLLSVTIILMAAASHSILFGNHFHQQVIQPKVAFPLLNSDPETVSKVIYTNSLGCLLYTSPSPRDATLSRMPSSA